jgi:hypothetical protein
MTYKLGLPMLLAVSFLAARAEAATQILGLLASNGIPTPLHCEAGVCQGFFSGFCLQQERPAPTLGSEYKLAPGSALTILAERADGRTIRVSGESLVTINVDTGFTSVGISGPEARLKALGAVSAAIEVAPLTSILPVPLADDPDPQSPEEVAQATGPARRLASGIFDRSGEDSDSARLIGLLINALPSESAPGTVALNDLFRQVVATVGPARVGAEGLAAAERVFRECESFPATSAAIHFCLEVQQGGLLGQLNEQLWDSVGGS